MKVLVAFSGGKDSLASLIWAVRDSGFRKESIEAVFCDTGWEAQETYDHIKQATDFLGVKLVTIRSKKYDGMLDMAEKKKRFPSTKTRFCTEELKTKPMIDYILDECKTDVMVIQGIRRDESSARSKMAKQCTYFKYYSQPYGKDVNGKGKFHTYRKADVLDFRQNFSDEVVRPVFDWTGQEVMTYILDAGISPNPLYYSGAKRVGCFPCIMAGLGELTALLKSYPLLKNKLIEAESKVGMSFFPPGYIPDRYCTGISNGKKFPWAQDVFRYLADRSATGTLEFGDKPIGRCMSFYGICE